MGALGHPDDSFRKISKLQGKRHASARAAQREQFPFVEAEARYRRARREDDGATCASSQHVCAILQATGIEHRLMGGEECLSLCEFK